MKKNLKRALALVLALAMLAMTACSGWCTTGWKKWENWYEI